MKKCLIIDNCRLCFKFEDNMYHGLCCWHDKVAKPHSEGKIPKIIEINNQNEYLKPPIPKWCPLDNY